MKELISRAKKEGERFWRELGVAPDSDGDGDYIESEMDEDEVDSDFDMSEDSDFGTKKKKPPIKKTIKKVVVPKTNVRKPIFLITKIKGNENLIDKEIINQNQKE